MSAKSISQHFYRHSKLLSKLLKQKKKPLHVQSSPYFQVEFGIYYTEHQGDFASVRH